MHMRATGPDHEEDLVRLRADFDGWKIGHRDTTRWTAERVLIGRRSGAVAVEADAVEELRAQLDAITEIDCEFALRDLGAELGKRGWPAKAYGGTLVTERDDQLLQLVSYRRGMLCTGWQQDAPAVALGRRSARRVPLGAATI
ncbi:hypothetical protein BJF79_33645 [Actinomadura sp. CNU-125]|nr:hypothetical protein BJF79_33645 [Actinomadura sp. CNU-125]